MSIALVLVGIALIPTGSASLGIALMALSLTLYGGVAASDEPMPYHPVNPPPPPQPLTRQRLLHILSVLAGAVGLYLIVRRSGFDTGATLIAAGFAVNVIDLTLNAKRYGESKAGAQ